MFDLRCANSNINTFTILARSLITVTSVIFRMVAWAKNKNQHESFQSVTGLWTKGPCCQERSQSNDKICSSWQMAHKNASNSSVPQWCAGGHLKSDKASQIFKWMDHSSKTPCQVPLCQLKTNERKPWWGCHHHCTAGSAAYSPKGSRFVLQHGHGRVTV